MKQIHHMQFLKYPLTMNSPYSKSDNRNNLFQTYRANILLENNDCVFTNVFKHFDIWVLRIKHQPIHIKNNHINCNNDVSTFI